MNSECSKLVREEYKTRVDRSRKEINEDLARNWNLTILPNGIFTNQNPSGRMTHDIFSDLEIQPDHLFTVRRPELIIINNKEKKREPALL